MASRYHQYMKTTTRALSLVLAVVLTQSLAIAWAATDAPFPANGWPVAPPETTGFPLGELEMAIDALTSWRTALTSLIVVKDGYLVYEGYWNGFSAGQMTALYSATKSINSLLTGIAIDKKILPDEHVLVLDYLSEHEVADPRTAGISLADVLTLRTGLDYDEWTLNYTDPNNAYNRWLAAEDRISFVLSLAMAEEPGNVFRYQTPASQLVPRVIEEATNQNLVSLAGAWLFEPLGISTDRYIWRLDDQGHTRVAACNMVPTDLAKIGLLILRNGQWEGQQIVAAEWLQKSMTPMTQVRYGVQFGYHWWLRESQNVPIIGAEGYGGQCLFVVPAFDLVVVTTGDFYDGPDGAFRILGSFLLPLLQDPGNT